jgi:hypothetical protein
MSRPGNDLRALEGRRVSLALVDGSRIDDCELVSAGRDRLRTIWVFADGTDRFLPVANVIDIWESTSIRSNAA